MISIPEIERVYAILDREISFLEMQQYATKKRYRLDNWEFVRKTFQKLCIERAEAEGIFKKVDRI